jgi:hypothetical protein
MRGALRVTRKRTPASVINLAGALFFEVAFMPWDASLAQW